MKRFVIFACDFYYPCGGYLDYHSDHENIESAIIALNKLALTYSDGVLQIVDTANKMYAEMDVAYNNELNVDRTPIASEHLGWKAIKEKIVRTGEGCMIRGIKESSPKQDQIVESKKCVFCEENDVLQNFKRGQSYSMLNLCEQCHDLFRAKAWDMVKENNAPDSSAKGGDF